MAIMMSSKSFRISPPSVLRRLDAMCYAAAVLADGLYISGGIGIILLIIIILLLLR